MDGPTDPGPCPRPGQRALRAAAWPLLVAASVLALLAPGLAPDRHLAWRDSLRLYAPLRPLVAEALRDGRLPLWDPFDGTGLPLFAQLIHGVLHPASVALALLAPGAHLDALVVAYALLAALGAYAAARALGAAPAHAAAAGVGYAGSGFLLSATGNLVFLAGGASLPWLLAAGRRAGEGARLSGAALALAAAAMALSGEVQGLVVGGLLALALALHAGGRAALPRVAAGLSVGALLSAVQLYPSWRFLPLTDRSLALDPSYRQAWALSPWRLPELLAPGIFGGRPALSPVVYRALEADAGLPVPFASSVFVGAALLLAAAAARGRTARLLLAAAALLLWLALGHRLGAEQLLHPVPIWGALRYAEKLVGPLTLVLCLLAALGAERLAAQAPARAIAAGAAAAAVAAGLCALPATGEPLLGALLPPAAREAGRAQGAEGLLHLALALGALAALLRLARRAPRAFPPAFAALVLLESLAAAPFALYPSPAPTLRPPVPLAPPPGARLHTPELTRRADGTPGALEEEAAVGFPGFNVLARVDNVEIYSGLLPRRSVGVWELMTYDPTGWRRYGLTHVVLPPGPPGPLGEAAVAGGRLVSVDERTQVFAVQHRPWASFAPFAATAAGPEEALRAVAAALQAGDPTVVVEAPAPPPTAPGRVLSVARGAEAVAIEAEADGQALLVVNDAFWPGWVAELDGAPVRILPADALVRAVPFPAGRHRLVMRYEPPEVRTGLSLAALGLLLLAALAALEERAWRRSARLP